MNTNNLSLLNVIQNGLGDLSWQEWVDHYNEKYDALAIDGFDFAPTQLGYTWAQLIASTGAKTLPAYVDPESPGYESALREVEGRTGNIPTMKKFYRLNRVTVQNQLQLAQKIGRLTPDMRNVFMGLLDEGTDGLIQAFYNALTHQRMQIVSTGKFTINSTNNPRGLNGIILDFNVPTANVTALTTTSRWWTNNTRTTEGSASDPIKDIKDLVKSIRRDNHYYGPLQMEIAKDTYDDLLTHSKVLSRIGHSLYPNVTDDATVIANAQNYSDEALGTYLSKLCGVTIVTRDTFAFVDAPGKNADGELDLVTTQIENFKANNIAIIPQGKIGDIQGVEPLTLGYDASQVARYNDGRLILSQRAVPETHSIYIDSEAAQLCVPSTPQYIFIKTVYPD